MAEPPKGKPTVENRWWVELGKEKGEPAPKREALAGAKFFLIAAGYDQDRARENLTDPNRKLLSGVTLTDGEWAYVQLLDSRFSSRELERIKRAVDLPSYAKGAVIDSGRTVRLLVTGTPTCERILELALVDDPSFDCWIGDEWVCEEAYRTRDAALAGFRTHIRNYLSPEALALSAATRAQA